MRKIKHRHPLHLQCLVKQQKVLRPKSRLPANRISHRSPFPPFATQQYIYIYSELHSSSSSSHSFLPSTNSAQCHSAFLSRHFYKCLLLAAPAMADLPLSINKAKSPLSSPKNYPLLPLSLFYPNKSNTNLTLTLILFLNLLRVLVLVLPRLLL